MTTENNLKKYLQEIKKNDQKGNKINSFIQLRDEKELIDEAKKIDNKIKQGKAGKLAGKIISVKSNINVKGLKATCASKVLENYSSTYNATVIDKVLKEDGLIIGMTNMDEFASGGSGETSAFGVCKNPTALGRIPGGSSSGGAASIAAGFCDIALASDTGGSIRNPSSHCGVVGLKPSYSSVSRYGLIDLSMSLDQIGPIGSNVKDVASMFDIIKGKDAKDAISQASRDIDYKKIEKTPKEVTIGVLENSPKVDPKIQKLIDDKINQMSKKYKWQVKKVKIDLIDLAIETYYPLVYVEFFSGTRRFNGRLYGEKIEDMCGKEVLRRILGGSEITKAEFNGRYYNRALKAKKIFEQEFEKAFNEVDCIITPVVPKLPHKIGSSISVEDMYAYDALTIPPNLAGNCALVLPIGKIDGIPTGLQIICDKFQEQKLFEIASSIERLA